MAANHKEQAEPESPRDTGPTAWQKHRRAYLEWTSGIQSAQLQYQRQIAEANVVYQTSLQNVSDDSWKRRLEALDAATQTPGAGGQPAEIAREHAHGVNEANRVAQEAYGRAWYGLQDKLQAAYAKYAVAVGELYRGAGGAGTGAVTGGMFAVGDEGPELPEQTFNPVTQFWGALGRM